MTPEIVYQRFRPQRTAKDVTLQMGHTAVNQPGSLLAGFYPFGHTFQVQLLRQLQHGIEYRRGQAIRTDTLNKTAIDFQIIKVITFQIDQRAVTGTEIINGDMDLLLMQPVKQFSNVFLAHHGSLGDLKHVSKVVRRRSTS